MTPSAPPGVPGRAAQSVVAALPIEQADQDFGSHNWDAAIAEYKTALHTGLPDGTDTTPGSQQYARHRLSLAYEYQGLADQNGLNYDEVLAAYRSSVAANSGNQASRCLLRELEQEQADNVGALFVYSKPVVEQREYESSERDVFRSNQHGT